MSLVALSLIGAAVSAYGQMRAADSQADAMRNQAILDLERAAEVQRRRKIREKIFKQEGLEFQAKQATAINKKGIEGSSGTALLLLEETNDRIKEQLVMSEKESAFEQRVARLNAGNLDSQANDIEMSGLISGLGTFAYGAGSTAAARGNFG
tara:strand:+ start:1507 stop:1962 length:456 start_codon:yes stop_codon:yes gene_type:complete